MRAIAWMVLVSLAGWGAARAVLGTEAQTGVWYGMVGPLVIACTTWALVERTHRRKPAAVTSVLLAGFAAKAVFFAGYVVVVLRVLGAPLVPFAVGFSSYFIVLHLMEAMFLRRLLSGNAHA